MCYRAVLAPVVFGIFLGQTGQAGLGLILGLQFGIILNVGLTIDLSGKMKMISRINACPEFFLWGGEMSKTMFFDSLGWFFPLSKSWTEMDTHASWDDLWFAWSTW